MGAPNRYHAASPESQMAHPNDDSGTKGRMGVCIKVVQDVPYRRQNPSQTTYRQSSRPRYASQNIGMLNSASAIPKPAPKQTPPAPAMMSALRRSMTLRGKSAMIPTYTTLTTTVQ